MVDVYVYSLTVESLAYCHRVVGELLLSLHYSNQSHISKKSKQINDGCHDESWIMRKINLQNGINCHTVAAADAVTAVVTAVTAAAAAATAASTTTITICRYACAYLKFGRFKVFMVAEGGRGFGFGGLKSKCWCGSTIFSVKLYAQHEPNINESTHMPICWPSDFMHSHTNIHVPSYPFAVQGFGLIFNVLLMLGIEFTSLHSRSIWSDETNHLLRIVDQKCNLKMAF